MKTYRKLYPQIHSFANLLQAAKQARKGKQFQENVADFEFRLEENLFALQEELKSQTYQPGPYRAFMIDDPKPRLISAAPYRDRVVHHALMNITAPIFERTFISDTYANRKHLGTHTAILRYQQYAKRHPYVLKADIRKFFPSIDHELLKQELRWKLACPDTLWLCDLIIDRSNPQERHEVYFPGDDLLTPAMRRRGLPIGNLTSQWWGNIYLNRFDHFVKEELRVPGYIRYVDDFVVFGQSPEQLQAWREAIAEYLVKLRLVLHPHKTQIYDVKQGVPFLGFRVYPHHRQVLKPGIKRYRRHLAKKLVRFHAGELSEKDLEAGLNSWLGHIRFAQTQRLENHIFDYIRSSGVDLVKHPRDSWRVLGGNSHQLSLSVSQQESSHQSE